MRSSIVAAALFATSVLGGPLAKRAIVYHDEFVTVTVTVTLGEEPTAQPQVAAVYEEAPSPVAAPEPTSEPAHQQPESESPPPPPPAPEPAVSYEEATPPVAAPEPAPEPESPPPPPPVIKPSVSYQEAAPPVPAPQPAASYGEAAPLVPAPQPAASYGEAAPLAPAPQPAASYGEAAPPVPAPQPQPSLNKYEKSCLSSHNNIRAKHGVPSLSWDPQLASIARQIATSCSFRHQMRVSNIEYGQNIGAGAPASEIENLINTEFYAKELDIFKSEFGKPQPNMGNFAAWGHFTQIVWKDTGSLGCYTADCSGSGLAGTNASPYFTVCNYLKPGNFAGEYNQNVFPPK